VADSFDGFADPGTQSSVMAVDLPGPYAKTTAGFTQEHMQARGWTLRSREDMTVDGLPGILVHFEQPLGGQAFLKWCLAFGDDRRTILVTAAFPRTQAQELCARLKSAVLSTRLDGAPDPQASLPFTVAASPKLKPAPGPTRTLTYTRGGVTPVKSPKDPMFIVVPALGEFVIEDKIEFAEQLLRETAPTKVKGLSVKSTSAITIDGRCGYESLAEAQDAESAAPLAVYQVILFDGDSYLLMMLGRVGAELRDEYLPEFKAMALSLKRKP
jgi:hypothetical protein